MRPVRLTLLDGSALLVNPDTIEFVRPPVALTEPDRPAVVHFTSGAEVGVRETVADLLKRFVAEA